MVVGWKSKDVAIMAVLASAYPALCIVFEPISYMTFNIRIANILTATVPIFGWSATFGIAIGVAIANALGPIGILDLLTAPIKFGTMAFLYVIRRKSVLLGYVVDWIVISSYVSYIISLVSNAPFIPIATSVFPTCLIGNAILPYLTLRIMLKYRPDWKWK